MKKTENIACITLVLLASFSCSYSTSKSVKAEQEKCEDLELRDSLRHAGRHEARDERNRDRRSGRQY